MTGVMQDRVASRRQKKQKQASTDTKVIGIWAFCLAYRLQSLK